MDIYIKAILIVFGLWIFQGILSYYQINHFRKRVAELKKKGKVIIGQQKGKLRAGSIVIIVIDDNKTVIDAEEMKGFTVFNKFKKKNELIGKSLNDIDEVLNQIKSKQSVKAIEKALENVN